MEVLHAMRKALLRGPTTMDTLCRLAPRRTIYRYLRRLVEDGETVIKVLPPDGGPARWRLLTERQRKTSKGETR